MGLLVSTDIVFEDFHKGTDIKDNTLSHYLIIPCLNPIPIVSHCHKSTVRLCTRRVFTFFLSFGKS